MKANYNIDLKCHNCNYDFIEEKNNLKNKNDYDKGIVFQYFICPNCEAAVGWE